MRNRGLISLLLAVAALSWANSVAWADGGRNRTISSDLRIEPSRIPIQVDGNLAEWDPAKGTLLALGDTGSTDAEAAFQRYMARIAFRFDADALYVAVWWTDSTPLGPEKSAGSFPSSDGLVLSLPVQGMKRMAFWRDPDSKTAHAVMANDDVRLENGQPMAGVTQMFQITGKDTYTQEIRIPWKTLGEKPQALELVRLAVELCYGGFDPALGYKNFARSKATTGHNLDRWGGNMGLGFMDGFVSKEDTTRSYDPTNGALLRLGPAGAAVPGNQPPVLDKLREQTHTTEMTAIPAGKIEVDGVLDDSAWTQTAGTTISYEPTLFPGRYMAAFRWAYDEKGLYAGIRWYTAGAQFNINNPDIQRGGFDGGDALQLRFAIDRISHVDLWQSTTKNRTVASIAYGVKMNEGKVPDALAKGVKVAFRPMDGGGYTEEVFLPWSLITADGKARGQGDSFRVIADLFFSGLEGNRIPYILGARLLAASGVVALPFTAPQDGYYSVVIDNDQSQVIRRMLTCAKLSKGEQIEDWDGLDDEGKPVAPGRYSYRGLYHTGIGLKYLSTYNNPGKPQWSNVEGTGEWGGDHSSPQAVTANESGVYLGWPSAEDGHGIIGCDFTGQRQWGFFQTPLPSCGGGAFLANDGPYLYYLNDTVMLPKPGEKDVAYVEALLTCLDSRTGQKTSFSTAAPFHSIARYGASQVKVGWWWDVWRDKAFSLDTYGIHDEYWYSGRCMGGNAAGIAVANGKIYVSLRVSGEVVAYQAADMKEIARWPLTKPGGLAVGSKGVLYAISDRSVIRLDPNTGKATPVINSGLEAPVGLALDATGNFFVSDWGNAQCVKVFSPGGKALRTIGTEGGRPWLGQYDSKGMLLPKGIAVDREGKLWVAEDDNQPRRVSVWNAQTGELIKEFIGGTNYGATGGGVIDPGNPRRAISQGVLFDIDMEKDTYKPLASMWRRTSRDAMFNFAPCVGNATVSTRYVDHAGRRFIVCASLDGPSALGATTIGELRKDGTWKPLAAAGGIQKRKDNPLIVTDENRPWRSSTFPEFFRKHYGENFLWTDLNGDGEVQEDEMQWQKQTPEFSCLGMHWGSGGVDENFNLYQGGSKEKPMVARFEFQGWTASGAPKYDFAHSKVTLQPQDEFRSIAVGPQGEIFTVVAAEVKRIKKPAFCAYDPQGKLIWRYPTNSNYRPMGNFNGDSVMGPVDTGGEAGQVVSLTQWHGLYISLLTSDGIFIGRVLRDPSEGGTPGPDMYRGETVQYLNRMQDGRVILSHGKNAHHLFEITGFKTVRRFQGNLSLNSEQSRKAAELLQSNSEHEAATAPIAISNVITPIQVDGQLDDWDWKRAAAIGPKTGAPRAEVAFRADRENLYIAYKVFKGGPFLNNGREVTQLFLSGDAVDFQYALDASADPNRKEPVMGDTRLLFSKLGDQPVAVIYRAKVPHAKAPMAFRSPARAIIFDAVETVPAAKIAIVNTPGGYTLEAAVPLKAIGLEERAHVPALWPGRVLRGDAGFIAADPTGRRVARIYRFNKETQVVSDVPTEAAISPALWGELEVDPAAR